MAYSADSAACGPLRELAQGVDLFVCEASLPLGRPAPVGMNTAEVVTLAA